MIEVSLRSSSHTHVLLVELVTVQYIKYVTESIFRFLADGSELVKECVFGDCMRLSNDEVITIGYISKAYLRKSLERQSNMDSMQKRVTAKAFFADS